MDPNANLQEQLALACVLLTDEYEMDPGDAIRLAELVEALDVWLSAGGFLPTRWQHERKRP